MCGTETHPWKFQNDFIFEAVFEYSSKFSVWIDL